MSSYLCHFGNYGSLGNWGVLNWIGLILNMAFWFALLAGLTLLVVYMIRRSRVSAPFPPYASGQQNTGGQNDPEENLKAQYARGEITREQYQLRKQELG